MFKSLKQATAERNAELTKAREELAAIHLLMADRATLVSIVRDGRKLRFAFVRNGQITYIECYGTMADDVEGWKRTLLERPTDG